jgi:MFS family permease
VADCYINGPLALKEPKLTQAVRNRETIAAVTVHTAAGEAQPVAAKHAVKSSVANPIPWTLRQYGEVARKLWGLPGRSRRTISEHGKNWKSRDREISDRSRWGLDLTNFFLADVQVGFGAFLAFYLGQHGSSKQEVGFLLMVGSMTALLSHIPAGALADRTYWKRGLAAFGIAAISISALILALRPVYHWVLVAEVLHGLAAGLTKSSINAISLGLAGRRGISARIGRNFRYAALGNAVAAAMMGLAGAYLHSSAIFYAAAVLCLPTLLAVFMIPAKEIDYVRARNAARKDHSFNLHRLRDVARNRQLLLFTGCLVLFHFSNASVLPLVSQNLGAEKSANSLVLMSAMIVAPQIIVAVFAPWVGYWSELWGRKPLLLIAFGCEALRALLFATFGGPSWMFTFQLLDGLTGSIMLTLTTLVIADLTTGSGRFNLTQGIVAALTGLAAAVSTALSGVVAQQLGDGIGFMLLGLASSIALIASWLLFVETKPERYED